MSLNPLNELKRRLDDDSTPLPKRLCLAKNVVQSHYFPTAPKERVIADWLDKLSNRNRLSAEELRNVLSWLSVVDDLTNDLKSKLIQVLSQYLQRNPLDGDNTYSIVLFLESNKIAAQLSQQIKEYLLITTTLLQNLKNNDTLNVTLCTRILNNIPKYYRESKKKLEFIINFIDGENLETLFSYLDTDCRDTVISVCQTVLFPMTKQSFFISFLQTLIRKDNIDELVAEKGDNIQSVLKIMSVFFTFPKGRTGKDAKFLSDFIDVFVKCFSSESQIIFAFYIMVTNSLNMDQSYLSPAMKMPVITFEENNDKIKRNVFLKMLNFVLQNEIDINVRLTDTFGEKISRVEIKKTFISFLQAVMMKQLKLDGKLDKVTLQIIKTALKLDPSLIEQKLDKILPYIMTVKKSSNNIESYTEMMNCLFEILFKLSRGNLFINQILPFVKINLEAGNTDQFELKQKIKECVEGGVDCEKLKGKVICGDDVLPPECIELYGKLTSELMFRQNKDLLLTLQKDFEEYSLMMLEEGFVSPSIITITEVLSAILSSFLRHNKMADHTVPRPIAEDFWSTFQKFEDECLNKFGACVLKLRYNPTLALSFLKLCLSFSQLKLLNIKYGNTKVTLTDDKTSETLDLSNILPCLDSQQWLSIAGKVQEDEAVLVMDNLLLIKAMAKEITNDGVTAISEIKSHLIENATNNINLLQSDNYASRVMCEKLDKKQSKRLAKCLVKTYLINPEINVFQCNGIISNKAMLNALVMDVTKNMSHCFNEKNLVSNVLEKNVDVKEYFLQLNIEDGQELVISNCVDILKQLQVHYLEEQYQLAAILIVLAVKKCCQSKKLRRNIDHLLQSIFELSPKYPDIYKIFPVDFIFSFRDRTVLDLLTLKIKTSNHMLIVKSILESAVKKVKVDSDIVKNIVEILLSKQKGNKESSIEYFSDPVFQISCIILPIIAKEKKAITTSAYRSILANLQEKMHKSMLESFKNIDFSNNKSLFLDDTGNIDESLVDSESALATLNAMGAYSLTLSKYCETNDAQEIMNLDCLWSGMEFFVQNAIQSIQNPKTKAHHIESSIQLLNVILRHSKKLDTHEMYKNKQFFQQIFTSLVERVTILNSNSKCKLNGACVESLGLAFKLVCELASVEVFGNHLANVLCTLATLKKPSEITESEEASKTQIASHKVAKYLWIQFLKANIVGPKCVTLSKLMFNITKNLRLWIQENYEEIQNGGRNERENQQDGDETENVKLVAIGDDICELLRIDLDTLAEVVMAAKKVSIDYKFLDSIFDLLHLIHNIMGHNTQEIRCELSWHAYFKLHEGSIAVLNSLLMSREEILEDRWPCYMQCFRSLITSLCVRSTTSAQLDRWVEDKLAENAHSVEKLTQSICKRKAHVSRIAAYTVADICSSLEKAAPSKMVRQHLENSVAYLIQASDSSYAMAFLRRALAGCSGQTTMTNLYTMYKRYHKYTGNA